MTNLWTDSCAAYASTSDVLAGSYVIQAAGPASIQATGGRWGAGAIRIGRDNGFTKYLAAGITGGALGFAIRTQGVAVATNAWLVMRESTTIHLGLIFDATNRLAIYRGNGTTLLATAPVVFNLSGADYTIQLGYTIHDTTGSLDLWVNDVQQTLSFVTGTSTTQDTRNGGTGVIDNIIFGGPNSGGGAGYTLDISEIYINSNAGSAPNNGVWGSYRIQAKRMTAAGSSAQWTPLSSTNVSNVDDSPANDGDTTYNSSATAGQIDLFQTTAITPTSGTVPAIMHRIIARKDDAGVRTIRPKQRQSSTNYDGTTQTLTTTYAHYTEVKEINPATGVAYTVAEMRATDPEFGYEIVA
jgi:hypothetical protein